MTTYLDHPMIRPETIETRLYQQVLFGTAIKENSLIVLPTGLGKTVVFMMVIAHYLKNYPDQSVIITAPTRPLVNQHYESALDMLNLDLNQVEILSGGTSPNDREALWSTAKVLIATPQTLRNDIIAKRVDLSSISLVCFDEAHRAVGDDPYVLCAEQYYQQNQSGRILGFTASPGNKEKVYEILDNLQLTQFEYMDEDHPHVKPYVHDVEQNWIWVELPVNFQKIQDLLTQVIKDHLQYLKDLGIIRSIVIANNRKSDLLKIPKRINATREQFSDDEFYKAMASYGQLMLIYQASEMLETQGVHTLQKYIEDKIDEFQRTNKSSLRRFIHTEEIKRIYEISQDLVKQKIFHPKLERLKDLVSDQLQQSPGSRILIFANYKATTTFLVSKLKSIPDVSVHRFVGQSSSSYGKGLTQTEQKQVMDSFKSGLYNVLVSTSVGEEGLDVAQCDLVIFYDVTPSATRLIQRSGRTGRSRAGRVVILITKGTRDEGYFYASRRQKQKIKQSIKEIKQELVDKKEKQRQTGLDDFFTEPADSPKQKPPEITPDPQSDHPLIYVDHRERGAGIIRTLLNSPVEIKQDALPVGDFLLSNRVAVERKTTRDFTETLIRGDLFEQLITLKNTFEKPILLIEGDDLLTSSMSASSIRGALASIMVDYDIPIYFSKDESSSVDILISIAKREQRDRSSRPSIRSNKTTQTIYDEQVALLSALPNINTVLAERILEEFETPKAFFEASQDDMKKVHGIGSQIADRIDQVLSVPKDQT